MLNAMKDSTQVSEDEGSSFGLDEESDIDGGHGAQDETGPSQKGNPSAQAFGFFLIHGWILLNE
jgi:hypothetical protein